ncbi:hypothetical protein PanWU01x14_152600 [Parasponia andersonii]|uniref:Uncharacterized protein n=1 Tax=Parasponia andersonii TaxID=3476 RepID=A0A2P5CHD6_PARAD|nr:hypothetical protein PanWU01x14_152600 [Parasponia andersonii]
MEYNNNEEERYEQQSGSPVHSQVRKIKEEYFEKIVDWLPIKPERRPVLREITRQLSRSPLGASQSRLPISVGD